MVDVALIYLFDDRTHKWMMLRSFDTCQLDNIPKYYISVSVQLTSYRCVSSILVKFILDWKFIYNLNIMLTKLISMHITVNSINTIIILHMSNVRKNPYIIIYAVCLCTQFNIVNDVLKKHKILNSTVRFRKLSILLLYWIFRGSVLLHIIYGIGWFICSNWNFL